MSKKIRHVLGISGGKDSAALAIYMKHNYPELKLEYYCCDTGKELQETYDLVNNLEIYLGQKIIRLEAASESHRPPFDHYLELYGGFLPSSNARWCTKKLKLEPFEAFVGDDPVVSYVGIRDDEEREGYISHKSNIQSIFPFRKKLWSEDVITKLLRNENIPLIEKWYLKHGNEIQLHRILEVVNHPLSLSFPQKTKLDSLLSLDIRAFNRVVHEFLLTSNYPLAMEQAFPLLDNDEGLVREDIFRLLRESGVGVPAYYEKIPFEVNGKVGEYARSRSGCFFCFFQQKIEWVWLYERHPKEFMKAMDYEKDGYAWMESESLSELIQPERIEKIKEDYLKKSLTINYKQSPYLLDVLDISEGEGCTACFV